MSIVLNNVLLLKSYITSTSESTLSTQLLYIDKIPSFFCDES
jgi:hypothetical protein